LSAAVVARTRFGPWKDPDWDLLLLIVAVGLLLAAVL
jgi:hypothetical protein